MPKSNAGPTFEASKLKMGKDWSVLVKWPDGREQYLEGFQTHDEMRVWINDKSLAWLEAQQIHASPSSPRLYDHIWLRFEGGMRA